MAEAQAPARGRGRPALPTMSLREMARQYTPQAIKALVDVCTSGESEAARVSAANALLDRGWGRPLQQVGDGDGNALDWLAILNDRKARV